MPAAKDAAAKDADGQGVALAADVVVSFVERLVYEIKTAAGAK